MFLVALRAVWEPDYSSGWKGPWLPCGEGAMILPLTKGKHHPHPRPQPVPAALSRRKKTENIAQETQVAPPSTSQRTDKRTERRASWGEEHRQGPWAWGGKAERETPTAGTQHSTTQDCSKVSRWPLASDRHWGWSRSGEGNLKELTFQELGRRPPGWERTLHGYRHSRKC